MALDLPALRVQISATTGDTVSKIDEVRNSLENVKDTNSQMSTSLQSTTKAAAESFGDLSGAVKAATGAATGDISGFVSTATGMLSQFGGVGALAAAGVGMIVDGVKNYQSELNKNIEVNKDNLADFARYADDVMTKSVITGLSEEFVDLYSKMSGITDVDFSTIESATTKLNEEVGKAISGDNGAIKKFNDLHIAIYGEDGKVRSTENIFDDVLSAIRAMPTEAEQAQAAADVFGKGAGSALLPLIRNANRSYAALKSIADEYRILNSSEDMSLGGMVQDWTDIRDAAEKALEYAKGLRAAEQTATGLQSEADYIAAQNKYVRGEITIDELYQFQKKYAEDVVKLEKLEKELAEYDVNLKAKEEQALALDRFADANNDFNVFKAVSAAVDYTKNQIQDLLIKDSDEYYTPNTAIGETDIRTNEFADALRYFPALEAAAGEFNELATYMMNSANRNGVDLLQLDDDWKSELKTTIHDLYTGAIDEDTFKGYLDDMFAGANNQDWLDTTLESMSSDLSKLAEKDPEINIDVTVEDNTKISFSGGQVNSDPDYSVSAELASAVQQQ